MKKILLNAKDQVLSRDEMSTLRGGRGMCTVYFDTVNGGCESIKATTSMSQSQATSWAESHMGGTINGSSQIVGYRVDCSIE